MVSWNDKWLGLAGGGFGFSAIGGLGVYQVDLYCMDGNPVPVRCMSLGKRLGITLQAEAAHAVCLVTGVTSRDTFREIKSNGLDWALSIGVKADSIIKSGGEVAQALAKLAAHNANWAAHETAKKVVQGLMGDFEIAPKSPSFILLPTPLGAGLGAGIYYEWQTLSQVGSDLTWDYIKPKWKLSKSGNRVLLHMHNIPEQDGTQINFHIRENVWGADNLIRFAKPPQQNGEHLLTGMVKAGKLTDPEFNLPMDGFDITSRVPVGKTEIGMLSVSKTQAVEKSKGMEIGVSVCKGRINLYRWESDDYTKVLTDSTGRIIDAPDTRMKD